MTEAEALQRYDAFLWKQVNLFVRKSIRRRQPFDDFIQEARIAFLLHIRTHDESEWAACTLTIRRALYDFARASYPVKVSHASFSKVLKAKQAFQPYDESIDWSAHVHEDDHTDMDIRIMLDHLSNEDRQIAQMRLEGWTLMEIVSKTGKAYSTICYRLKAIQRKIIS